VQQYLDLLRKIRDEGEDVQSGATIVSENRKATCRFLLGTQLRFDLRQGFPAVTTKKLLFDWVVDEILWFLRGETNVDTLGRATTEPISYAGGQTVDVTGFTRRPIWDQWARPDGDVPHIYGETWRRWPYPDCPDIDIEGRPTAIIERWDQVADVIAKLRSVVADPAQRARRRVIITAWDPPMVDHMGLPPCHTLSQWLPTNGYLDCVTHWRSIDMFTGCPFNIAQYALLAHIFAGVTGLRARHLVCNIVDCHLYDNQFEQVTTQCCREPYPSPTLAIDDQFFRTAPDLTVPQLHAVDPAWFSLKDYRFHPGRLKAEIAV
jgi:thymidylate synthase